MAESLTGAGAAHDAFAGGKEAALELLDIFFDWILPIVTLVVGYLLAGVIGLSGLLATIVDGTVSSTLNAGAEILVADLVATAIWGACAGALWSAQGRTGGKIGRWIMRPLGALFAGFALAEIGAAIQGKVLNGQLGTMSTSMETRLASTA